MVLTAEETTKIGAWYLHPYPCLLPVLVRAHFQDQSHLPLPLLLTYRLLSFMFLSSTVSAVL